MSLTRTGPLTLRMIEREVSSMNSTRTWVTPPREPVRPRTYGLALTPKVFFNVDNGWGTRSWKVRSRGDWTRKATKF